MTRGWLLKGAVCLLSDSQPDRKQGSRAFSALLPEEWGGVTARSYFHPFLLGECSLAHVGFTETSFSGDPVAKVA